MVAQAHGEIVSSSADSIGNWKAALIRIHIAGRQSHRNGELFSHCLFPNPFPDWNLAPGVPGCQRILAVRA